MMSAVLPERSGRIPSALEVCQLSKVKLYACALMVLVGACWSPALRAGDGPIEINGLKFESWSEYTQSDYFRSNGKRCGFNAPEEEKDPFQESGDCPLYSTNPTAEYDPGDILTLQVVVHVLARKTGEGAVPDSLIHSQIDILNEDFLAIAGSNGEDGTYGGIQFVLASDDPDGNPTNGITRHSKYLWFLDAENYWDPLAWDPNRYINIYTNLASGYLGYVPWLPQNSPVGSNEDRIVVLHSAFGRNAPIGPPYDQGRTLTHEMGHYLGLWHTFDFGCGSDSLPTCYTSGDRICDTESEASNHFGCPVSSATCDTPDPIRNYMNYTDDLCMWEFTTEQVRRMRCTTEEYRGDLVDVATSVSGGSSGSSAGVFPVRAALHLENLPNPFNPVTEIRYRIPEAGPVRLDLFSPSGRLVRTLVNGVRNGGDHAIRWDGSDNAGLPVASGVYFSRLQAGGETITKRMALVR